MSISTSVPQELRSDIAGREVAFPSPGVLVHQVLRWTTEPSGPRERLEIGTIEMMPGSRLPVDPATSMLLVCSNRKDLHLFSASGERDSEFLAHQIEHGANTWNCQLQKPITAIEMTLVKTGAEPTTAWVMAVTSDRHPDRSGAESLP